MNAAANTVNKRVVVTLYRSILRAGRSLRYTDQRYFKNAVRVEFEVQVAGQERERLYKLGENFLKNKLGGLI